MSYTYVTRSGKTVKMENGVTTITKTQNGQSVTRQFNLNNVKAGTVIGQAEHVQIGGGGNVKIGSRPKPPPSGPPGGGGGGPGRGNRNISNQFNITGSVIGQVAIGNKGKTVFNNKQQNFQAGSNHSEFKIKGGNFAQANLGGTANYNNDKTAITAGEGGTGGPGGPASGKTTIDDFASSDMVAEKKVSNILKFKITTEDFITLLKNNYTLDKINEALEKTKGLVPVTALVTSMLRSDANDPDSD